MKSAVRFARSFFSPFSRNPFRCPFSSPSSSAVELFADPGGKDAALDSPVYLRSVLRRPPTLKRWSLPRNSCSFIGTVVRPVTKYRWGDPKVGVYTVLEVKGPSSSSSSFRIVLEMWNELSEISLRHLKPDDHIYVSGSLRSYEKVNFIGTRETQYKIVVSELNFVKNNHVNQKISQKSTSIEAQKLPTSSCGGSDKKSTPSGEVNPGERYGANLRLWQVFFASPHEWWDNRKEKKHRRSPDFKHKDTKECLWLRADDPPWVRKQLQLHDSRMGIHQNQKSDPFDWKL